MKKWISMSGGPQTFDRVVLFGRSIHGEMVYICADRSGKVYATIKTPTEESKICVSGIPLQIDLDNRRLVKRVQHLLNNDCVIFKSDVAITVFPKLRGGYCLLPMGVFPEYSDFPEWPKLDKQAVIDIGRPLLVGSTLFAAGLSSGWILGGIVLAEYFFKRMETRASEEHHADLVSQLQSIREDLLVAKEYLESTHAADVLESRKRSVIDKLIHFKLSEPELSLELREFNEVQKREILQIKNTVDTNSFEEKIKALHFLADLTPLLFKGSPVAQQSRTITYAMTQALRLGRQIISPTPMSAWRKLTLIGGIGEAIGTALSALVGLPSPSNDVADLIRAQFSTFKSEFRFEFGSMISEVASHLTLVEQQMFRSHLEIMRRFGDLSAELEEIRKFNRELRHELIMRMTRIEKKLDEGFAGIPAMKLTDIIETAKVKVNLGGMAFPEVRDYLAKFTTWAKTHSRNRFVTSILTPTYTPDVILATLADGASVGTVNYLVGHPLVQSAALGGLSSHFPDLPNLEVWARSCDAYMNLQAKQENFTEEFQTDGALINFLDLFEPAKDFMNTIERLRVRMDLFEELCSRLEKGLSECLSALGTTTPIPDALIRESEAHFVLLRAVCEWVFPNSMRSDFGFKAFFESSGPMGLNVFDKMRSPVSKLKAGERVSIQSRLSAVMHALREAIRNKGIGSSETSPILCFMLNKLNSHGRKYFPGNPRFECLDLVPDLIAPTDIRPICSLDPLLAIIAGDLEGLKIALGSVSDFSKQDAYGRTLLHAASCWGFPELVKELVIRGANPTVPDSEGNLPIHLACASGNPEVVRLLLRAESPTYPRNMSGVCPKDLIPSDIDPESRAQMMSVFRRPVDEWTAWGRHIGNPIWSIEEEVASAPVIVKDRLVCRRRFGDRQTSVRLYEMESGRLLTDIYFGPDRTIECFKTVGLYLICGTKGVARPLPVYRLSDGQMIGELALNLSSGFGYLHVMSFVSLDEHRVAIGYLSSRSQKGGSYIHGIEVWDLEKGARLGQIPGNDIVMNLMNGEGETLLVYDRRSALTSGEVVAWNYATGVREILIEGDPHVCGTMRGHCGEKFWAVMNTQKAASEPNQIYLWVFDKESRRRIHKTNMRTWLPAVNAEQIFDAIFDREHLITSHCPAEGPNIRRWSLTTGECVGGIGSGARPATDVGYMKDIHIIDDRWVLYRDTGLLSIAIWDLQTNECRPILDVNEATVPGTFSRSGVFSSSNTGQPFPHGGRFFYSGTHIVLQNIRQLSVFPTPVYPVTRHSSVSSIFLSE